ncbi:MAG TPA: helix-turn-helix domain-containing protein [Candidatus Nanoarchaeia archaeon]|nr:helix-turn-helix domain-containing protein [Candidatus Nanoarchaeia archaeon]
MKLNKESLAELKENFRLNIYEVKIWTSLLSRGISSAAELADISGVPRSRCYDVLETLEKKGFIIMKIGKPIKYIAIPPLEVVSRVEKEIKSEAERVANATDELKGSDTFRELELLFKTGITFVDPLDLATSLSGKSDIAIQVKSMLERAKSKVILSVSDMSSKKVNALKNSLKKSKKGGAKLTIYAPEKKIAEQFREFNAEIGKTQLQFLIVDGKEMLLYTTDQFVNPQYENAIWLNSAFVVKALETLVSRNMKP